MRNLTRAAERELLYAQRNLAGRWVIDRESRPFTARRSRTVCSMIKNGLVVFHLEFGDVLTKKGEEIRAKIDIYEP